MEDIVLIALVFLLGLKHGLDADHLACIDGLIRHNWRMGTPIARWIGTLFSFGHGLVVAGVAVILGMFTEHFTFPAFFEPVVVWISIVSLFLIGSLNVYSLTGSKSASYQIRGIKGKWIPRFLRETTHPFLVVVIGALFAFTAETVSQMSVWILAAGKSGTFMPIVLGITFMLGMMLTDTVDSLVVYRMMNQSGKLSRSASRIMGWIIVALAYGVAFFNVFHFFNPWAEVDFQIAGMFIFALLILCFAFIYWRMKLREVAVEKL